MSVYFNVFRIDCDPSSIKHLTIIFFFVKIVLNVKIEMNK